MGNCLAVSQQSQPGRTPEFECEEVARLYKRLQYRDGQEWYVVSAKWWTMWKKYSGFIDVSEDISSSSTAQPVSSNKAAENGNGFAGGDDESVFNDGALPSPGRISTEGLVRTGRRSGELKPKLTEGYDYHVLPGPVYDLLEGWYGTTGPALPRVLKLVGHNSWRLDLYPLRFDCWKALPNGNAPPSTDESVAAATDSAAVDRAPVDGASSLSSSEPLALFFPGSATLGEMEDAVIRQLHSDSSAGGGHAESGTEVLTAATSERLLPHLARVWLRLAANGVSSKWTLLETSERRRSVDTLAEDALGPDGDALPVQVLLEWRVNTNTPFPREGVGGGGSPGRAEIAAGGGEGSGSAASVHWREELEVGAMVDALDSDKRWFEARIVDAREGSSGGSEVKVHYLGWTSKWDAWIARASPDLQPLHGRGTRWRDLLRAEDWVEVSDKALGPDRRNAWHLAVVLEVQEPSINVSGQAVPRIAQVQIEGALQGDKNEPMAELWVPLDAELACQVGTHTKKSQRMAADQARRDRLSQQQQEQYNDTGSSGALALTTPERRPSASASSLGSPRSGGSGRFSPWAKASIAGKPPAAGAVGLANLGNTCFMNSMLQCLAQSPPLTAAFRDGSYKAMVNRANPLGTGGKLAEAWADVVRKMFSGSFSTVVPKEFKQVLGKFAPQFAGYQQQDSQEFMSFLLDGLHEDLNRVQQKPYTEAVESDGQKPDDEVASEAWRRHLLRNDSIVVDTCQGLLQSHLTCSNCRHQSVTFDPYMSLSLPLPSPNNGGNGQGRLRPLTVTVVPWDYHRRQEQGATSNSSSSDVSAADVPSLGQPRCVELKVPVNGTVADLKRACVRKVAGWGDLDLQRLRVCDVWQHRIYKAYRSAERLVEIRATDETVVYELPPASPNSAAAATTTRPKSSSQRATTPAVRHVTVLMARESINNNGSHRNSNTTGMPRKGSRVVASSSSSSARSNSLSPGLGAEPNSSSSSSGPLELFGVPWCFSLDTATTTCADVRALCATFAQRSLFESRSNGKSSSIIGARSTGGFYTVRGCDSEGNAAALDLVEDADRSRGADARAFAGWLEASAVAAGESPAAANQRALVLVWQPHAPLAAEALIGWQPVGKNGGPVGSGANGSCGGAKAGAEAVERVPLLSCFEAFTEKEQLGSEDLWYCSKCKDHVRAFKKFDLWTAPDVLILHLKRFEYIPGQYFMHRQKIEALVEFPLQSLDLSSFLKGGGGGGGASNESSKYDLFAVSEHLGGLGGGHYTAVAKNAEVGQWFAYDDTRVSPVPSPAAAITPHAYVLFYQRQGAPAKWGGLSLPSEQSSPPQSPPSGKSKKPLKR